MTRNLKVLGLTLAAMLSVNLIAASACSAAQFTSEGQSSTITGEDDGAITFGFENESVACSTATFHAVILGASTSEIHGRPTYAGCETPLGVGAKVTGFGQYGETLKCSWKFKADGKVDLSCDTGAEVTIEAATCTYHLKPQTNLSSVSYTSGTKNAKHDLLLHFDVTDMHATVTDGFICPYQGASTINDAELTGTTTIWGEDPSTFNPAGITRHA